MFTKNALQVSVAFLLIGFFLSPALSQSTPKRQWGAPVEGLQLSIYPGESFGEFRVAFRNVGEKDSVLNLGIMLANGRVQLPDRVTLELTDASGNNADAQVL
jgi:hypothetical protein